MGISDRTTAIGRNPLASIPTTTTTGCGARVPENAGEHSSGLNQLPGLVLCTILPKGLERGIGMADETPIVILLGAPKLEAAIRKTSMLMARPTTTRDHETDPLFHFTGRTPPRVTVTTPKQRGDDVIT